MGNTYYCTYSNRNTGQQETFECPCDLCWQEWFPNSQNPCPSCSGTASGLDWYYWFLIAIGILLVISLVVSIFVCWRKRKQRSILLVELNNTDRNIVAPQHVPKVENSNTVRNPPTSNNIARTKPQPQQKPQQNSQNVQDKPQAPQVVNWQIPQ